MYHVMCRGNNGRDIFFGDKGCEKFLDTASRSRLMVWACVLGLIGLALMSWSLFDQGWIPIMMAMSPSSS